LIQSWFTCMWHMYKQKVDPEVNTTARCSETTQAQHTAAARDNLRVRFRLLLLLRSGSSRVVRDYHWLFVNSGVLSLGRGRRRGSGFHCWRSSLLLGRWPRGALHATGEVLVPALCLLSHHSRAFQVLGVHWTVHRTNGLDTTTIRTHWHTWVVGMRAA